MEHSESEWNIVEEPTENIEPASQSFSQTIIITTLNNRLNDISDKMDLIISKLDNLDKRLETIEENNKVEESDSEYDPVIFNNPDIENIIKFDEKELESFMHNRTVPKSSMSPVSSIPKTPNNSPIIRSEILNDGIGLKYFSTQRNFKANMLPPFSYPY